MLHYYLVAVAVAAEMDFQVESIVDYDDDSADDDDGDDDVALIVDYSGQIVE